MPTTAPLIEARRYRAFRRFVVAWTLACFILGGVASWQSLQLREGAAAIDQAGRGLERTGASLQELSGLPIVGDRVAQTADSVEQGGESARSSAATARSAITTLSIILGLAIALLPTLPLLLLAWLLAPAVPAHHGAQRPQ